MRRGSFTANALEMICFFWKWRKVRYHMGALWKNDSPNLADSLRGENGRHVQSLPSRTEREKGRGTRRK